MKNFSWIESGQLIDHIPYEFIKDHLAYLWKLLMMMQYKGYSFMAFTDCGHGINFFTKIVMISLLDLNHPKRTI